MSDARLLADFYRALERPKPVPRPPPNQIEADPPDAEREPWPEWWTGPTDPLVAGRCRMLWVSVLARCLADSLADDAGIASSMSARSEIRKVGASWWRSKYMREVADLAGFDGVALQQRLHARIAREGIGAVAREAFMTVSRQGQGNGPRPGRD